MKHYIMKEESHVLYLLFYIKGNRGKKWNQGNIKQIRYTVKDRKGNITFKKKHCI